MDRRYAYRLLIAGLGVAGAAAGHVAVSDLPLTEARWIAPGRDPVTALTREPAECLQLPADAASRQSVEIGRAAFRDPRVLGGVAARVGLSCSGCHRGGHGNPDFHFPGLSGEPGTADTTSAVTSERRDDAHFNPRPIPSLTQGEGRQTVSRDKDQALERFIHGLVVDEFAGPEPTPAVLKGLADYVRALRRESCPARPHAIMVQSRIDDAVRALDAAATASAAGDGATARTMIASARAMIGGMVERLPRPVPDRVRAELTALAVAAGRLEQAPSRAGIGMLRQRLAASDAGAWQSLSLYDPQRLARVLAAK